jgi:hypothetical protein
MNAGATRPSRVALVLAKRRSGADECTVAEGLVRSGSARMTKASVSEAIPQLLAATSSSWARAR